MMEYCARAPGLETIRLSNCGLTPEIVPRILSALLSNSSLKRVNLDVSKNALGPKLTPLLVPVLSNAPTLAALDLSDNGVGMPGLTDILRSLPPGLQCLRIGGNFGESKTEAKVRNLTYFSNHS